ncbi:hypothetical protein BT63DRAFT_454857 [Microthyrium microscopicum]|uniref:Uncharacterized protein n=1 Tax=Microthyrium microscopicum TaxID=703497 RepID=A0A6A6UFU2_9PEZI|nr:hypothetical protein BT63DRAFT_454857 [Microthyrium microscopicum]
MAREIQECRRIAAVLRQLSLDHRVLCQLDESLKRMRPAMDAIAMSKDTFASAEAMLRLLDRNISALSQTEKEDISKMTEMMTSVESEYKTFKGIFLSMFHTIQESAENPDLQRMRSQCIQDEYTEKCQQMTELFTSFRGENIQEELQKPELQDALENLESRIEQNRMED